nr:GBS Bsp-like repeat-containing protein [Streptococcus lutetiensis]
MNKIKSALLSIAVLSMAFLTNSAMADQQSDALVTKTPFDEVSKSFEVMSQKTKNCKDITRIDVAVWSEENGQDDLKWYNTTDVINGQAKVKVNLADYGNRAGSYITHVYTTYSDGRVSGTALESLKISPKAPQVSVKNGALQLSTDINAPSNGTIKYAVWSEENDQNDLIWYDDYGKGITRVDLNNHKGYGRYFVHTYLAQDGKLTAINGQDIIIDKQEISYQIVQTSDKTYDVLINDVPEYITSITVPVWSTVNNQDDLKWYKATKVGDNSYKATIQLSNHGFDTGTYGVHIYGDNSITNSFEALSGTPGFHVDQISGLENPEVGISNVNTENGLFKVNVMEKAVSKRVSKLKVQVTSKSNSQKTKTYEAGTSSYGKISQSIDLKSINNQADTFSVVATVIYSDNLTATFNLSDQNYKPSATQSPRITTYINETNTYPVGQCTWAVKSLAPWIPNWLGNAGGWAVNARAKGFRVGTTPRVGSIVVWPHDGNGYGHVAYVTDVSSNTRIQVKESNYAGKQYIANFRGWFNPLDSFWGGDVSYIYPD